MNSHNIVVFDESVIGDSVTVPVVIGEKRKSGGSNNNYVQTRQARLGCYIPFSMPDGTTSSEFSSSKMRMWSEVIENSKHWHHPKNKLR